MEPIIDLLHFVFFGFYLSVWTKNFYFGAALPLLAQILFQWLIGPAASVDYALTAAYPASLAYVGALLGYLFLKFLCLPRPLRRGYCYLVDWIKTFLLWALLVLAHAPLQIWPLPTYVYGWLLAWAGSQILIFVWLLFSAAKDEWFARDFDRRVFFWNWFFVQIAMMAALGTVYLGLDKLYVGFISAGAGFAYLVLVIFINTFFPSKHRNCVRATRAHRRASSSSAKPTRVPKGRHIFLC